MIPLKSKTILKNCKSSVEYIISTSLENVL